jgi:hypothetical protein
LASLLEDSWVAFDAGPEYRRKRAALQRPQATGGFNQF